MEVTIDGDMYHVKLRWGDPAWVGLRDAGFTWNRAGKFYMAVITAERTQVLEALRIQSNLFEQTSARAGFVVRHRHSYDYRESLRRIGGRWNPNLKAWVMPTQEALDRALAICDGAEMEPQERPPRKADLPVYTAGKEPPPVEKGGIITCGTPENPQFYRALHTPEKPTHFAGQEHIDHFTGHPIKEGYMWWCHMVEVEGEERQQLMS